MPVPSPLALTLPTPTNLVFSNGFEGQVLSPGPTGWNDYHLDPGNRLVVTAYRVREGTRALGVYCLPGGGASKAEVQRTGLHVGQGQVTRLEWSLYVDGDPGFGPFFLADLEDTSYSLSPGVRVFAQTDDSLAVELKGYGARLEQPYGSRVPLPTRQWVDLAWTFLPDASAGWVTLEQNGVVVLDGALRTLPSVGDQVLDRLGVGCTANSGPRAVTMFVDRVQLFQ